MPRCRGPLPVLEHRQHPPPCAAARASQDVQAEQLDSRELIERAARLTQFAQRLQLFSSQRLCPSDESQLRVRSMLQRYADLPSVEDLHPGSALTTYFLARFNVVRAAKWLGMHVH